MAIQFDDTKKSTLVIMPVGPAYEYGYDDLRQGIELVTQNQFYMSIQPKIWSGNVGHELSSSNYGQTIITGNEGVFNDITSFDPVKFVEGQDIPYETLVMDDLSSLNFSNDGALEPFALRDKISRSSINIPFEPNDVKGTFLAGNIDSYDRSDIVTTKFIPNASESSAFVEGIDDLSEFSTSVRLLGYTTNIFCSVIPFKDGSSTATNDEVLSSERFTSTGYPYYDVSINIQGLDSIAYVGLLNR